MPCLLVPGLLVSRFLGLGLLALCRGCDRIHVVQPLVLYLTQRVQVLLELVQREAFRARLLLIWSERAIRSSHVFREDVKNGDNEHLGTQRETEEGGRIVVIANQNHVERPGQGANTYEQETGNKAPPVKVAPLLYHVVQ